MKTDRIFNSIKCMAGSYLYSKVLSLFIGAVCLVSALPVCGAQALREWTVIAYINGDNNLDPYSLVNFHNMEGGVHGQINVVALLDRSRNFNQNPQLYSGTRLYFLKNPAEQGSQSAIQDPNQIMSPQIMDLGELDLSSPENITNLIQYAANIAPARHYAFVAWNHGGGWRNMMNDDDGGNGLAGRRFMTIQEFAGAVKNAAGVLPRGRFDLLILDQCLMGQLDVLSEISSIADFAVASPPIKWANGPDYSDVFKMFAAGTSVRELTKGYVDNYIEKVQSAGPLFDAAMSAYDLSGMNDVTSALAGLVKNLNDLVEGRYMELTKTLGFSSHLVDINTGIGMGNNGPWSVNVRDWLFQLEKEVPGVDRNAIFKVRKALDRLIIKEGHTRHAAAMSGVAIYLPLRREYLDYKYFQTDFARKTGLDNLLGRLYRSQELQGNRNLRFENIEIGKPVLLEGRDGSRAEHFKVLSRKNVKPLSKNVIKFDVVGENILWTRIRHFHRSGNRKILDYVQLVTEAVKEDQGRGESALDRVSPKYNNGRTTLMREIVGLKYKITNGTESRDITVTNISAANDAINAKSSGWALYTDSTLFGREVLVKIDFNNAYRVATAATSYDPSGTNAVGSVVIRPDSTVKPRLSVIDDSGREIGYEYGEPLHIKDGLYLTLGPQENNAVEGDILTAETISGKSVSASGPEYRLVFDPQQLKYIDAASKIENLQYLLGRFALNQYVTGGNEVILMPNYRVFSFSVQNGRNIWSAEDSAGGNVQHGTFSFIAGGGIPQIILSNDDGKVMSTLYLFLEENGSLHQWYAIETGVGTRFLLVPLSEFSGDPLEGEWSSDTEIWKFRDGKVNYQRLKKGEEINVDGTYTVNNNMIRVKGLRFDEYAFYVNHERNGLSLVSRKGHISTLTGKGHAVKRENTSDAEPDAKPSPEAVQQLEGFYVSGADTGYARLTVNKFADTGYYSMFLETRGQGNIICNFRVTGNQLDATFPDGSRTMIGYRLDTGGITLYFPDMPPLQLYRK